MEEEFEDTGTEAECEDIIKILILVLYIYIYILIFVLFERKLIYKINKFEYIYIYISQLCLFFNAFYAMYFSFTALVPWKLI